MAPIFACTSQAPLGKQESGDEVAKRIRSISSGAIPVSYTHLGRTLTGFMRKINRSVKSLNVEKLEDIDKVIEALKEN